MTENEIIARQDRIVYILLVFFGSLGLVWSLWMHMRHTEPVDATQNSHLPAVWSSKASH